MPSVNFLLSYQRYFVPRMLVAHPIRNPLLFQFHYQNSARDRCVLAVRFNSDLVSTWSCKKKLIVVARLPLVRPRRIKLGRLYENAKERFCLRRQSGRVRIPAELSNA